MSGFYNHLEVLPEYRENREKIKKRQNRRLLDVTQNRPLAEINADRKMIMRGSGGGLPDEKAYEEMEQLGKTQSGGRSMPKKQSKLSREKESMGERAHELGKLYAEEIKKGDGEVRELVGSGFFEDFGRGFMSVIKPVVGVAKHALPFVAPGVGSLAKAGLEAVGFGKAEEDAEMEEEVITQEKKPRKRGKGGGLGAEHTQGSGKLVLTHHDSESDEEMEGGAGLLGRTRQIGAGVSGGKKKRRAKASASDNRRKRGALVSNLMKEKGLSLGEASKYIKEHGLL